MVCIFIAGTTFQKSMPSFRGKHSTHAVGIAGCNTSFFLLSTGALARLPHAMLSCVTCNSMWHARSLVALQAVHNASPPQCSTLPAWHSTLLQSTLETLRNFALHTPHPWHFDTFACCSPHYFTLCTLQFPLHTQHSTPVNPHSTLQSLHFTLCTPCSTPLCSHSAQDTPHSRLNTLRLTLSTLHPTRYLIIHLLHRCNQSNGTVF